LSRRYYRFADDMRQVCPDCVIPIHSHQPQRWAGNKASADSKEPTQDSNDKPDNDQINRVDICVGDWKKHGLFPAAPQEAKQEIRHRVQNNGLTDDKQDGDAGINVAMVRFEVVQPIAKKMKNQEKVNGDQNRIDHQFDSKSSQTLSSLLFHEGEIVEA
jgi:hypothetical protein